MYCFCRSAWGDWPYGEWYRGLGELWAAISRLNTHLQLWCRERLVDTYITVVKIRNQVLVQNDLSHRPVFTNVIYMVATSWHMRAKYVVNFRRWLVDITLVSCIVAFHLIVLTQPSTLHRHFICIMHNFVMFII